jgi:hypothetical protein
MSAGHAEHFLSRLDRVSWQQMEYALALYNDAPMVSHVLAALRLGPEVERVALSLDHPELGPFVVVTRDAKFVTCLGHGMRPTGLKVVPRERYEAIIERKSALTEACARAAQRAGGDDVRGIRDLVKRVYVAGPNLSREEVQLLVMLAPIVSMQVLSLLSDVIKIYDGYRSALLEHHGAKRVARRAKPIAEDVHREYFRVVCAAGHLSALLGEAAGSHLDASNPEMVRLLARILPGQIANIGAGDTALRAAWGAGRVGKPLLVHLRHELQRADVHDTRAFSAGLGVLAIGARHSKLRAEAFKSLQREGVGQSKRTAAVRRVMSCAAELADNEAAAQLSITHARLVWALLTGVVHEEETRSDDPAVTRSVAERVASIDDDLPMALQASRYRSYFGSPHELILLCDLLTYFAAKPLERLYLPRATLAEYPNLRWGVEAARGEELIAKEREFSLGIASPTAPTRVEERPGRNDACTCGSGKKYKRCCGA